MTDTQFWLDFGMLQDDPSAAPAGAPANNAADLAKKLANPIASLISVPFQFNYDRATVRTKTAPVRSSTFNR